MPKLQTSYRLRQKRRAQLVKASQKQPARSAEDVADMLEQTTQPETPPPAPEPAPAPKPKTPAAKKPAPAPAKKTPPKPFNKSKGKLTARGKK